MLDDTKRAKQEVAAAYAAETRGDYRAAAYHYSASGELVSGKLQAWSFHEAAVAFRKCGESEQALIPLQSASDAMLRDKDPYQEAQIHLTFGNALADCKRWHEATEYSRKSRHEFESLGYIIESHYGAIGEACCLAALGEHDAAATIYKRLAKVGNPQEVRSQALNNLALLNAELGNETEAIDLVNEDLRLCKQVGDSFGEFVANVNMAQILAELGRDHEARSYTTIALSLGSAYNKTPPYVIAKGLIAKNKNRLE